MKRAVGRAKRKQAGTGAKRKAPRRRSPAKTTSPSRTRRSPAKPKRSTKTKAKNAKPSRKPAKRKSVARKGRLKPLTLRSPEVARPSPDTDSPKLAPPTGDPATVVIKPAVIVRQRKSPARRSRLKIPAILLEGDEPESAAVSGPGEKFSLGPETPTAHFTAEATHLPATYGTGRLFLTARDPHWLYAHWDINTRVQFQHNARSVDRHLILRMYEGEPAGQPVAEIHVHPESRHWFAHVERAGAQYTGELGYYQPGRKWKSLATSAPMRTPPDTVSTDSTVTFATIPLDLPFETLISLLKQDDAHPQPLAHALQQLSDRRLRGLSTEPSQPGWTLEQERALAEVLTAARRQPAQRGSAEISTRTAEAAGPSDWASSFGEYVSSPLGGEPTTQAFWLNVNAELIIYGATEPGAKVSIGGKPIALQPDGSFSYRFALPDGHYELPVVAVSADDTDGRAAELRFSRTTEVFGNVGAHPQDPALKPPTSEAI